MYSSAVPQELFVCTAVSSTLALELPPREPLAGMVGVDVMSTVVYRAAPHQPHQLVTLYVFPERARWWLGATGENRFVVNYRYGSRYFDLSKACPPRAPSSMTLAWT